MNIMIACRGLRLGGSPRDAANISRWWAEDGHDVTFVTELDESTDFCGLHPRVQRLTLGYSQHRNAYEVGLRICAYRRLILRVDPQVVIGMGCDCGLIVSLAGLRLPCRTVICEFGVPQRNPMRRLAREWIRRKAYYFADAVTSESHAVSDWLKNHTWARRSVIIHKSLQWPLPVEEPEIMPEVICQPDRRIILAAGRLVSVKGFDSLIRAFAVAAEGRTNWDLVIVGEGNCRRELEVQIKALGLQGRVLMPSGVGNPGDWYQRASIFAVSSLHEGGPNVLIEALANGVPAVSYDCDEGPRTIIRNHHDGILVPPGDERSFADSLMRLMDDKFLREDMAARAVEARERFSEQNCMQHWDKLFGSIGVLEGTAVQPGRIPITANHGQ